MHDIINYSTSFCPFESGKCGKEENKNTNIWISWEWKELFRWNHIFHSFWKATAWKESKYRVFSGPYFSIFRLNTEIYGVNLPIQFKHGKILTRKNPILETFCIVEIFDSFLIHERISLNPWPSNFGSSQNGLLGWTFFFIYVIFASDVNLNVLVTGYWCLCACVGSCVFLV